MPRKKKEVNTNYIQLDLIPPTEIEKLYKEFTEVKESSDKVRRGVFAKHTELSKKVQELTCQIESLQNQMNMMANWIIQHGHVQTVQLPQEESHETVCLHITKANVAFAEKLHPLHIPEFSDILILSA